MATIMVLSLLAGCGNEQPISNSSKVDAENYDIELTAEEKKEQKEFAKSSPGNDTDVGLRNIKLDKLNENLTDEQKMIIDYFDEDYLTVPDYEFLRRYPNVYNEAQINIRGFVKKVISSTNDEYKLVLWLVKSEDAFFYRSDYTEADYNSYINKNSGSYVVVTGKPSSAWFMEGDFLQVYGRYSGINTVNIDGTSYTIPEVSANKAFISYDLGATERYDVNFIKTIAKTIFGNNIEVRKPLAGTDYDAEQEWRVTDEKPFYVVELENQSNAKFTKYRFYTAKGFIEDAKTGLDFWLAGIDMNIQRSIEFSADFNHFFLFTYDTNLETLNLDYYDKSLNKIWNREFEETTNAVYDFTKNNIYLVANNELYIINAETGEDSFQPEFIGEKQDIRKMSDGILTIGKSKSDAVIKNNLDGNMLWKTNLSADIERVDGVQILDNNIILQLVLSDGVHYVVLDKNSGSVIADAISLSK